MLFRIRHRLCDPAKNNTLINSCCNQFREGLHLLTKISQVLNTFSLFVLYFYRTNSSYSPLMLLLEEKQSTIKDLRETVRSQAHTIDVSAGKSGSVSLAGNVLFFVGYMNIFWVHYIKLLALNGQI